MYTRMNDKIIRENFGSSPIDPPNCLTRISIASVFVFLAILILIFYIFYMLVIRKKAPKNQESFGMKIFRP